MAKVLAVQSRIIFEFEHQDFCNDLFNPWIVMSFSSISNGPSQSHLTEVSYDSIQLQHNEKGFQAKLFNSFEAVVITPQLLNTTKIPSFLSKLSFTEQKAFFEKAFLYFVQSNEQQRVIHLELKGLLGGGGNCSRGGDITVPFEENKSSESSTHRQGKVCQVHRVSNSMNLMPPIAIFSRPDTLAHPYTVEEKEDKKTLSAASTEVTSFDMQEALAKLERFNQITYTTKTDVTPFINLCYLGEIGELMLSNRILEICQKKLKMNQAPLAGLLKLMTVTLKNASKRLNTIILRNLFFTLQLNCLSLLKKEIPSTELLDFLRDLTAFLDALVELNLLKEDDLNRLFMLEIGSLKGPVAVRAAKDYILFLLKQVPFSANKHFQFFSCNKIDGKSKNNPVSILAAFEKFEEKKKGDRYNLFKVIQLLFANQGFLQVQSLLNRLTQETRAPYFQALMIDLLMESIKQPAFEKKEESMMLMADIFNNDIRWKTSKDISKLIFDNLSYCAAHLDETTKRKAKKLIDNLKKDTPKQQGVLNEQLEVKNTTFQLPPSTNINTLTSPVSIQIHSSNFRN